MKQDHENPEAAYGIIDGDTLYLPSNIKRIVPPAGFSRLEWMEPDGKKREIKRTARGGVHMV